MKSQKKNWKLLLAILFFSAVALTPAAQAAEVWTDQEDYAPWEIVTIAGSGFAPSTQDSPIDINVTITWPDGYVDGPYTGTTDDLGNFVFIYGKDKFEGTYTVLVEDSTGITATTTFTDSVSSVTITSVSPTTTITSLPADVTVSFTYSTSSGTTTGKLELLGTTVEASKDLVSGSGKSDSITITIPAGTSNGTYNVKVTITNTSGTGSNQKNDVQNNAVVINVPTPPSDTTPPVVTITAPADGGHYRTATLPALAYTVVEANPYTVVEDGYSTAEGVHTVTVTATDAAGNVGSDSVTYTVDNTPPTVTIEIPDYINIANESAVPVTITSNENGTYGYDISDGLSHVTGSGIITGGVSVVLSLDLSGLAEGTVTADASVEDAVGNIGYALQDTALKDTIPPEVTIDQALSQADPTNGSPINFAVVFSESVSDFATGDVTLTGSAGATIDTVTGSGTTYSVSVSGMTSDGTVIASIAAGVAHDIAGNPNSASTSTDNTVTYDTTPPEITITTPADGAVYLLNEVVNADWEAIDELSGVATTSATKEPGEAIDTATVGEKSFTVEATDNAGNTNSLTVHYKVQYDFGSFLPPVVIEGKGVGLFKQGSTIPVKFQLFDAAGNPVSTAVAKIRVVQLSNGDPVGGTEVDGLSTSGATTGNLFRYDPTGQLYIFNLATKSLAVGTWRIIVNLDDNTSQTVDIGLRK